MKVGNIGIGGDNPVRVQSMCTTSTMDTEGCVRQILAIARAGGELVRLTTQGVREAENLKEIRRRVREEGCDVPLVADVHFNPHVAEVAALYCEKVRINPGNYVDAARQFKHLEYTDEEYQAELQKIEDRLIPFLNICKEHHTAVRIGVNHGSLSDRIMSRYGDTPEGIVESCMEFLRICMKENFLDVVVSIKASNTVVMVESVRLLVKAMDKEGMTFPLHLGVTEAGEGEDGRIKSAVGIGALLVDGIGDTIRVSLSEAPENEIPVAYTLLQAARLRFTKTEYISCPGCGRTLFDLQGTIARVKKATSHLTGLKIAVMGCIVNGPGEMADADYGYVGAARGKVSLYKGKQCIEMNIPEDQAVERLLEIIGPSPRSPRGGEGLSFFHEDNRESQKNHLPRETWRGADPLNYKLLKDFARENRYHPTEAEDILWRYLKGYALGYPFRRQHIIGNFIADFACLPKRLIIEIDGLYHQLPEQQVSDEERTKWLQNQGYQVVRFTNEQIIGDIDMVLSRIKEYLK